MNKVNNTSKIVADKAATESSPETRKQRRKRLQKILAISHMTHHAEIRQKKKFRWFGPDVWLVQITLSLSRSSLMNPSGVYYKTISSSNPDLEVAKQNFENKLQKRVKEFDQDSLDKAGLEQAIIKYKLKD
jgi:hypothetical protein